MAQFEVDEENYQNIMDEEFSKGKIVILNFSSEFCQLCSALEMELDQLDDMIENVSIITIDCVNAQEIAEVYDISQFPTMIIYRKKDDIIHESEGVILAEDIQKIIESKL
jgi:thiol-disulfide isomerase/thioredoxin